MANTAAQSETKPKIPAFYKTDHWINSIGKMSLNQRLQYRIEDIKRKLPNLSLAEKYEIWRNEPYYEVSKIITQSPDWKFPKDKDGK